MKKAIIGKKVGMTQVFMENGECIPVTVILAGPCAVVAKKTIARDGYSSAVVGFDAIPERKLNKAELGQFKKASLAPMKTLKEFRFDDVESMEVGATLDVTQFAIGDKVDVCGTTRGRGFTGVIQRWNQHRVRMTHGSGPVHRQVGSMGSIDSARVFKLKNLPGRYGHERVTILNLSVVKIDLEKNVILVKGAVPGPKGSLVTVINAVKKK